MVQDLNRKIKAFVCGEKRKKERDSHSIRLIDILYEEKNFNRMIEADCISIDWALPVFPLISCVCEMAPQRSPDSPAPYGVVKEALLALCLVIEQASCSHALRTSSKAGDNWGVTLYTTHHAESNNSTPLSSLRLHPW